MYLGNKTTDYIICVCREKTLGDLQKIIRTNKITKLKPLCETANVGNRCGACREMLEELLQQEEDHASSCSRSC